MRAKIERAFLALVRLYTFYTPIRKGKYRIHLIAMAMCRYLPEAVEVPTRDGRRLSANLTTGMETAVYFHGEYESVLTEKVIMLLRKGDVCLDVGANFGWYTTLFYDRCGPGGGVHSFEPVPSIYKSLTRNYELMGCPSNVILNNLALGDQHGQLSINLFEGLSTGHASLSNQGRDDAISFTCEMVTLDSYLEGKDVGQVHFVKVDIEGSELMFLNGAELLFKQDVPPIWLVEMALKQTGNFGYTPNDIIAFFKERAEYDFYAVNEISRKLERIDGFPDGDIGANVFCIPRGFFADRTARFLEDLAE